MPSLPPYDAIILGAGGAGLMAAATAAQKGAHVLLCDHNAEPGRKILISGGGRCNFTNIHTSPDRYLSANPHFSKSALSRYTPADFIALVDAHGIAWHEKTLGQLFCDGSARQIVGMLMAECAKGGVHLALGQPTGDIAHRDGLFHVGSHKAAALVVATGGPSIPKIGASDAAYRIARQFGLKIIEPRPALVPLTLGGEEALFRDLSGVAAPVEARAGQGAFREAALFTHKGLSGPAILQASSYWRHGDGLEIDFLPGENASALLLAAKGSSPRATLRSTLSAHLPDRLAGALAARAGLETRLADTPDKALRATGERLNRWTFRPNGTEGYAKAEVTLGGVSTADLSSQTMEARRVPGLFVIGEAVDVTGWLGGYNLQWAWSSGVACGKALANRP